MDVSYNMKQSLSFALIIISLCSCKRDLTCSDFKNGEFLIPGDSLISESTRVFKKDSIHTELDEKGNKSVALIKYNDDCNYTLMYLSESDDYDEFAKFVNQSGGLHISVLDIKGDTLSYMSKITNDTLNYEMPGKMIKLN